MPNYTLTINGKQHTVDAAADTPLIYVLTNELHLTGPRLGCGVSQCGACAVLADGREIRACTTTVSQAARRRITTIEGLPSTWAAKKGLPPEKANDTLHPIQQAWIDVQVPQCGYCQSGMMIAAAELLEANPNPTVPEIKQFFSKPQPSPHLCRCGTYVAIIEAVQRAGKAMA